MIDFSLGYESDGEHHGLGVGLSKPPDNFTVRKHLEDGTYIETAYVPKRTCSIEYAGEMSGRVKPVVWFCSECGSPIYNDMKPAYCIYCGAEVVDGD